MLSTMAACCCSPPSGAPALFMRITTPAFGALNNAFLRVMFAAIALGLLLGVQRKWSGYRENSIHSAAGVINSGLPFLMYCLAAQWLPAGLLRHA